MKLSCLFLGSAMILLPTLSAYAEAVGPLAIFADVSGKVLVNQGVGYISAKSGMTLNAGEQVIVSDAANAAIRYVDVACTVELAPQSFSTIAAAAPCIAGNVAMISESVFVQPVMNAGALAGATTSQMVIGGVLVVGVLAAGVFYFVNEDGEEASVPAV